MLALPALRALSTVLLGTTSVSHQNKGQGTVGGGAGSGLGVAPSCRPQLWGRKRPAFGFFSPEPNAHRGVSLKARPG